MGAFDLVDLKTLDPRITTREDMVIDVDYSSGTDPAPGILFRRQADVDAHGAVKHLMAAYDALPLLVIHDVEFNLTGEDHLPRPSDVSRRSAWAMVDKLLWAGAITINGAGPSEYTPFHVSLVDLAIASFQVASDNPYITFSGTPFASYDLRGSMAVLSTGQTVMIHDHDDSTLYVLQELSPDPTGGTVTVARPKTRLLNDNGSGARLHSSGAVRMDAGGATRVYPNDHLFNLNDVVVAPYGGYNGVTVDSGNCVCLRVIVDSQLGPSENGWGWNASAREAIIYPVVCSRIATIGDANADYPITSFDAAIALQGCYIQGGKNGCWCGSGLSALLTFSNTVINGIGQSLTIRTEKAAVSMQGGQVTFWHYNSGKVNEIRDLIGDVAGLLFVQHGYWRKDYNGKVIFTGLGGPCVNLLELADLTSLGAGQLIDGGGNTDVGVQIVGPYSMALLDAVSDVSGSAGDMRIAGSVVSYSSIEGLGPQYYAGYLVAQKEV